ncbi:MAG: helix-hairpin-helix domain-containing protein [Bacteroidales bacterium]|nr:helix-hairpin-helix domain-containing protein [Bacteroidales bacterium]
MREFIHRLQRYFSYSKTERNGIFILSLVLLLTFVVNLTLPVFLRRPEYDFTAFLEEVQKNRPGRVLTGESENPSSAAGLERQEPVSYLKPFPFDPNQLPEEKWKELGLNDRQIKTIRNYENKGGRFRNKEDFSRIYNITPEEYAVLEPYIVIRSEPKPASDERHEREVVYPLFHFDPNGLPEEKWKMLGLGERLIKTIKNYEAKGGTFQQSGDLQKIYGMNDSLYRKLEPYIAIPENAVKAALPTGAGEEKIRIDLNEADTLDLQQLKGIGPSFARRITAYRESLGGYVSVGQLMEVYGMDSARYHAIEENLSVQKGQIKKININQAGIKEFTRHPYIDFYLAKSIIVHRDKAGFFTSVEQIREAKLVYNELYLKIAPYLTVE